MEKSVENQPYLWILGIDVSKESIDTCLIRQADGQLFESKFHNNLSGFRHLKAWCKQIQCECDQHTLCCMEHTGLYTRLLVHYLLSREVQVWLESSLQIKRSQGLVRGKSDKIDAQRIARYAYVYQNKAEIMQISVLMLEKLKDLQANMRRLMKALQSLRTSAEELKQFDASNAKVIDKVNREAIRGLEKSLDKVDEQILSYISEDESLKQKYDLMISIKGVGKVLAAMLLVYTHGFNRLADSRKLACYSGVAPFVYESGTSIRGKTGVSKFANGELKRVLHMAAISSVQHNPELHEYYQRKIEEGKNKMSVINAVRNKLLHRIVAVVKRGTSYELQLKKSL
ncbi:MAG: IS110 family transposase [Cyclobacteriaceae bacterium]|nr:IS110 family transposase [Cyclobacteriaceae bacterium]